MSNVLPFRFDLKEGDLILLFSDNYDGQVLTREAYKEVVLQMSTGDWHCHTATPIDAETASVFLNNDLDKVLTLDDLG